MNLTIEVFQGTNGGWYWRLVGGNGEIVGVSESYTRKSSAMRFTRKLSSAAGWQIIS